MRCKRCTHFNLHCSLEGSPPRSKATVLPSINDSFPQVPSPPPPSRTQSSGLAPPQQPQQNSRRTSPPPATSRNFSGPTSNPSTGSNQLRGPSPPPPPPSSAPLLSSNSRERPSHNHNYSTGSDSSGAPSPHQPYGHHSHPHHNSHSRSTEYSGPPAPPIQHVQQQQSQGYPQSATRYSTGASSSNANVNPNLNSNYRGAPVLEPLGPPHGSSPASGTYRSHTPQHQHQHYPSPSGHHPHHSQSSSTGGHGGPPSYSSSGGGWGPPPPLSRGITSSPHHTSAPVPPAAGPSPRSSHSHGSRGGTPRVPAAYIIRTDSSVGGGYAGSTGIDDSHSNNASVSSGGTNRGQHFYQAPLRPLAPPSPPLNLDPRKKRTPMDIVATTTIAEWGSPANMALARQMVCRFNMKFLWLSLIHTSIGFVNVRMSVRFQISAQWGGPISFMRDLLTPTAAPAGEPTSSKDLVAQGIVSAEDAEKLTKM